MPKPFWHRPWWFRSMEDLSYSLPYYPSMAIRGLGVLCALAVSALLVVACGGDEKPRSGNSSSTRPVGGGSPSVAVTSASPSAVPTWPGVKSPLCERRGWGTGRCHRPRLADDPFRTITTVRVGGNAGRDRITFLFADRLPGFGLAYVKEVIKDPSGEKVRMPGKVYLEVSFSYAMSDQDSKTRETKLRPSPYDPVATGRSTLLAYVMTEDHHGASAFVFGLARKAEYRVRTSGRSVVIEFR